MIYQGKHTIFNHIEQNSLYNMILNEDDTVNAEKDGKSSISMRVNKYLVSSGFSDLLDVLNVLCSLLLIVVHVLDAYFSLELHQQHTLGIVQLAVLLFFIANFQLNLFISDNKILFLFSTQAMVEYLSVMPTLLVALGILKTKPIIQFTRAIRYLCLSKLEKLFARKQMELTRNIFRILFTFTAIILIESCFLMLVESPESQFYGIFNYLYFCVITLTTVGYGDIYAESILGRMSIIVCILLIMSMLPAQSQDLLRVYNLNSKYMRTKYKKSNVDQNHIILLGTTSFEGFKTFLSELYHQDHGDQDTHTVILQDSAPSEDIQLLMKQYKFQNRITFLEGNMFNERDLRRCQVENSSCVVILANKQSRAPSQEDHRNILHSFCIKQYFNKVNARRNIRVCLQMLKPENKDLYFKSLGGCQQVDQVICVEELKLYLLAKTCLCPGISTLISFLITSNKPSYDPLSTPHRQLYWIDDYLQGMQNEIYRIPLDGKIFEGISFNIVAKYIYQKFLYIMIAVEVLVLNENQVYLNPTDYIFDDQTHYVYVLADSLPDYNKLKKFEIPDRTIRNYNFINTKNYKQGSKNQRLQEKQLKKKIKKEKENELKSFHFSKQGMLYNGIKQINEYNENQFENHIIVCGIVQNMKHLLMPLRCQSLKTINQVIILHNDPIPSEIWQQINHFPKVYFMQGSPLKLADLDKARIQKASSVVILGKQKENDNSTHSSQVDADTIFIYKTVKLLNPQIRIITELGSINTISFLSMARNQNIKRYGYIVSEPFASGEIYVSTMLDSLICQAYYNPFITSILYQFIMGNAFETPSMKKIHQQQRLQQSNLFLVEVSPRFQEKHFSYLFDKFTEEYKMIPIGLYRAEKAKQNNRPYVFIKPSPDLYILPKDQVYVLAEEQPKEFELDSQNVEHRKRLFKQGKNEISIDFTLKSKLRGDEGLIDTEQSKELNKLNLEFFNICKDFKSINLNHYSKGLSNQNFIPQMRQCLREGLQAGGRGG